MNLATILSILIGLVILGLIVIFHEFGHFIFCKIFNVRVLKFSIGFGPPIWRKKIGETEFSISPILFGGYVAPLDRERIKIMEDSKRELREKLIRDGKYDPLAIEKATQDFIKEEFDVSESDIKYRSIDSKPFFAKFSIVFAGPLFNIILSLICLYLLLVIGVEKIGNKVGGTLDGSPAQLAGILPEDEIIEINGTKTRTWDEIRTNIIISPTDKISVKVKRGEQILSLDIGTIRKNGIKVIGILPDEDSKVLVKYGIISAIPQTFYELHKYSILFLKSLRILFTKEGVQSLAGPIGITKVTSDAAKRDFRALLFVIFFISFNLAILNLLPIPILDGGHILLYTVESIIKRPLSLKVRQAVTIGGLFLLILLLITATWNDFRNFILDKK